ncbi:alpha beta-hydrolase [Desarmillaria ectypa]|nr:alpha beta-hydrolase [Desarmillaria ectypa]
MPHLLNCLLSFFQMSIKPFFLNVSEEKHQWIMQRVQTAYIIPDIPHPQGKEWDHGTPSDVVKDLVEYWKSSYDWRKVEEKLNSTFDMFTVELEEAGQTIDLHFVHHRSARANAIPLIFVHGWPGSFLEVEGILKLLTEPDDPEHQAFHIVAPSIPGFAFSSPPTAPGFSVARIASMFKKLMDAFPPSPSQHPFVLLWLMLGWLTPSEKRRMNRMQQWFQSEMGYALIQGTKPQTVSYGLLDSPVGMLAWLYDKLHALVAPGFKWDKEVVITWTMMYILSGNAGHARIYKESMQTVQHEVMDKKITKDVAVGVSAFEFDTAYIPKWWADAVVAENIVTWREHNDGGHFPALECNGVLADDIREFVRQVQGKEHDR